MPLELGQQITCADEESSRGLSTDSVRSHEPDDGQQHTVSLALLLATTHVCFEFWTR